MKVNCDFKKKVNYWIKVKRIFFFFNPDSKYFSLPTRKRLGSQIRLDGIARKILFSRLDKHSYINHQIYVRTLLYLSKIYICDKSYRQKLPTYWFLYLGRKYTKVFLQLKNILTNFILSICLSHKRNDKIEGGPKKIIYIKCSFWLHDHLE